MKALPKNTYTYQVMQWLKRGLTITSKQAIDEFGCIRLAEVIHRLRNEYGLPIKAEDVKVRNRNGRFVKIARYQLITE
jgi:hypothetical protein